MRLESQKIEEFLRDRGAGQLPHPGGTLHEHLVRVAALLAEWGAGEDLQAAGLCHACYGTVGYPHAQLGLDEQPGTDPAGRPEQGRQRPAVTITGPDHLVLTVTDARAADFYQRVLGMRPVTFGAGCRALEFGTSKINLHQAGQEITPHADRPTRGSADLCLVTTTPTGEVLAHLGAQQVPVDGPPPRAGARGPITSIYIRDPDGNLVEIASYPAGPPAGQAS